MITISGKTYENLVEKYKIKKTTDDCYTPPKVYMAIKDYVINYYKLGEDVQIVRPFYPGGDFENFTYPEKAVVIDNPPFSILSKIKDFYCKNNVRFFLFAPNLTLFSRCDDESVSYIITGSSITYDNGVKVPTSFVTNLDEFKIRTDCSLMKIIADTQVEANKILKYEYPDNLISAARLTKYVHQGLEIKFKSADLHFVSRLDCQKKYKKHIFGAGYLISNGKVEEMKQKLSEYKDIDHIWTLSEREKEIINNLGGGE